MQVICQNYWRTQSQKCIRSRALRTALLRLRQLSCKRHEQHAPPQTEAEKASDASLREKAKFELKLPVLDYGYICDPTNRAEISQNIAQRKGVGDVEHVVSLYEATKPIRSSDESACGESHLRLVREASKIPNRTHDDVKGLTEPKLVCNHGTKRRLDFGPRTMEAVAQHWRLLRSKEFGKLSCHGAYYLQGDLALLERALIDYTVDMLRSQGFALISVPDLVHPDVIEACGVSTTGDRTLVYSLDQGTGGPSCLSGTAEMALAGMLHDRTINGKSLPMKLAAISRCYRAEAEGWGQETGLYRVHEFNKVEMFVLCEPDVVKSEAILQEILKVQQQLFADLGLHYQVLEMPPKELAAAAYHKYDIEAWMVGRKCYGEISSASNCTDYQSRRLRIQTPRQWYPHRNTYAHTVNGTACAVPRMLIAIIEQNQQADFTVKIPEVLWPYLRDVKYLDQRKWAVINRIHKKDS